MTPEHLSLWVIYDNPRDHPGKFVVREQRVLGGGRIWLSPVCELARDLQEAREKLPAGLYPLGRQEGDDPAIAEVWV